MAVDDLVSLRDHLPEVFSDVPLPPIWDDDWLFIPIDRPEESGEVISDGEALIREPWLIDEDAVGKPESFEPRITQLPDIAPDLALPTSFAGAPQPQEWTSPMPPPDAFAFYLPFHYFYPTCWGVDQCRPGYRRAPEAFRSSDFERHRSEFAEANQSESLPLLPKKAGPLWHCFPHAFSGISRVTSRVNYVVRRSSPLATRLGLNLRYLRYRELRDKLLTLAKCSSVRQGKGSHEIWKNPSGHTFPVPRHPREIADGLLASVIKQSGLKMSVSQFLSAGR